MRPPLVIAGLTRNPSCPEVMDPVSSTDDKVEPGTTSRGLKVTGRVAM